ncbi:MAG TPA: tryptophan 2,3-dioxygenase family protein [bacterium]|nr:tryptophan 2,3-dioxygenase family protein [bacterium]
MSTPKRPVNYTDYLQLAKLLDCQELESERHGKPVHDEHLFIVIHQAYELWFKQILFELDAVLRIFRSPPVDERHMGHIVSHLQRIVEIERVLLAQISILETMTPLDFLDFRGFLVPASGFQSLQFRLLENRLGLPRERRLKIENADYLTRFHEKDQALLQESEREPSLLELVDRWLARTPFLQLGDFDFWAEYEKAVHANLADERARIEANPVLGDEERAAILRRFEAGDAHFRTLFDQKEHDKLVAAGERRLSHAALLAALLVNLYRDEPILHPGFRVLTLLMDVDEGLTAWRHRHALMVWRMIGTRVGTGGTSGTEYLREAAERYKVFTDLFNLSTFFLPRSALPALPDDVKKKMSFQYSGGRE